MEQRRLLVGLDDLVDSRWLEQVDKFIEAHKQPDGVHTYIVEDGILRYVGLDGTTQSGWLGPHSCVSINYIALKSELGSALNPCNLSFALTDPFWWAESDIVWWLAYSAFGLPPYDQETCRYLSRFLPDRAISCRGIDRLQHIMLNHASSCLWQPCFTLRVPDHSDLTGQNTQYSVYSDVEAALCRDNGIFTTALCVSSLASTLLRKASSLC
jgi:hypothetical protein